MSANNLQENLNNQADKKNGKDNNYLIKLLALSNGLKEEKKKNAILQEEIDQLIKTNKEFETQNSDYEKENSNLKIDNASKRELIEKLKEQLQTFRDKNSSKKNIKSFITSFLDTEQPENIEEKDEKEQKIDNLQQENIKLQNELEKLKNDLKISDDKLNEEKELIKKLEEEKNNKLSEIESENQKKIIQLTEELTNTKKQFQIKNSENEKKITEYEITLRNKEKIISSFGSLRDIKENDVNTMREIVRQSEEKLKKIESELSKYKKQNENMNKTILNNNKEIEDLKIQIQQYKYIIEEITPLNTDYMFKGKIIPNHNGNENYLNNLEVCFGKYEGIIYMKIDDKELNLMDKEIVDVLENKYIPGQIKFILNINDNEIQEIICQFTKKEGEYIRKFFRDFKNHTINKDETLYKMSLSNYFY